MRQRRSARSRSISSPLAEGRLFRSAGIEQKRRLRRVTNGALPASPPGGRQGLAIHRQIAGVGSSRPAAALLPAPDGLISPTMPPRGIRRPICRAASGLSPALPACRKNTPPSFRASCGGQSSGVTRVTSDRSATPTEPARFTHG